MICLNISNDTFQAQGKERGKVCGMPSDDKSVGHHADNKLREVWAKHIASMYVSRKQSD